MLKKSNNKSQLYISRDGPSYTPISSKSVKSPKQFKSTSKLNILTASPISSFQPKKNSLKQKESRSKSPLQLTQESQTSKNLQKKQIQLKLKQMVNGKNLQAYKNQHLLTTPISSCKNNQPHSYLLPITNTTNNKTKKILTLNSSANIKTPKQVYATTPLQNKNNIRENKENIPVSTNIIKQKRKTISQEKSGQKENNIACITRTQKLKTKKPMNKECKRLSIKVSKQSGTCTLHLPSCQQTYTKVYFISDIMHSVLSSVPLGADQNLDSWREQFLQLLHSIHIMSEIQEFNELVVPKNTIRNKKTIVFDLDETLVFCSQNIPDKGTDYIPLNIDPQMTNYLTFRPFLKPFILSLLPHFRLCIFTASQSQYANCIVNSLNNFLQCQDAFDQVFTRDECTEVQPNIFVKDIRKFEIPLQEIVIVDNVIYSFAAQIENGIPVKNFQGEKDDCQLVSLAQFLMKLKEENDVRNLNRKIFKVKKFLECEDPETVIRENFKEEWEFYMNQCE